MGVTFLPSGPATLILMFALTLWPETARLVQARAEELVRAPFVQVARMQGLAEYRIFPRELLPNLWPLLQTSALLTLANGVLLESILGFLGLGMPLGTPGLGRLIALATSRLDQHGPLLVATTLLLMAWLGGCRAVGRRSLDPRDRLITEPVT